ncbi:MAG: YidC/Oxa1 family membrane protein insertase, partial [Dehalococcoidia bacterium]
MDLFFTLFDFFLVDPMTNMLVALARLFGGSFGMAIIAFTLIMRGITWPLTAKQYKQSRAMQQIQPKVAELQKKYKGKDPKKMQQEMMALYREAGVNPLGCLLPMLVQFPIWIALYQVIRLSLGETPESFVTLSERLYPIDYVLTAVPLDNHLGIWNLAQNDPTFILPIVVAVTMYVQQKMITPRPVTSGQMTQQQQQQQQTQQMMTWMLPLMFGWISTTVPSGLSLYWAVSNAAGIVMQYFYAGRRLDWRNLLSFGPPAQPQPAKSVRPDDAAAAAAKTKTEEEPAPEDGAAKETSTEPGARDRSETR